MSKLFDLIQKNKGGVADAVRAMIPEAVPAAAGPPVAAPTPAEPPATPTTDEAEILSSVRTCALRVPAPSPLFPFGKGQWRPSEQYRLLRTKIVQHPKQPRAIVISSPAPRDGKTVSAINIAAALSLKDESRVVLIDADMRASSAHVSMGLPESPGLSEVLAGRCAVEEALVRPREFPSLWVLPAGTAPMNPVELLDSQPWRELCSGFRQLFRYVIVDSPPVGAVADYELIQVACDGVILVVRPDSTDRTACQKALEFIPKGKFLGVVMNCVPDWSPGKNDTGEYYHYYGRGS